MNKKFFIAWLVAFVLWMLGSFVVHGLLLQAEYAKLPNLFRPEAESQAYFPLMILAHVIKSGALAWICARGVEAKPWMAQGVRFGGGGLHVSRQAIGLGLAYCGIARAAACPGGERQPAIHSESEARPCAT